MVRFLTFTVSVLVAVLSIAIGALVGGVGQADQGTSPALANSDAKAVVLEEQAEHRVLSDTDAPRKLVYNAASTASTVDRAQARIAVSPRVASPSVVYVPPF